MIPTKTTLERTLGWWLKQEDYRTKLIGHIFTGPLKRPGPKLDSVYQILEFENPVIPLVTVSLFDLSPKPNEHRHYIDRLTINLKNYTSHRELRTEEVWDVMGRLSLNTQYLRERGYLPQIR